MYMHYVSFPGLGIESFGLKQSAFTLFGVDIMWYGILITAGMILAYFYGLTRAKIEGVKSDDITDLTLFLVIFGVIGARLYYLIFNLDAYIVNDRGSTWNNIVETLKGMVSVRSGGLAIYGGIIAGFFTALAVAKVKKIRFPVLLDILAPCVMIGQIVGRWGNFVNVEAYGRTTDLPWRMGVGLGGGAPYVHPTFLYESLWNLVGFILIAVFYKKKKFHGQVFLFYAIWYGAGRAFIEGLRTDSLYLGPIRISQLVSAVICAAGIILMVIGCMRAPRAHLPAVVKTAAKAAESAEKENSESHTAKNDSASEEISSTDTESAADGSENAEESAEKDTAESKEEDNG